MKKSFEITIFLVCFALTIFAFYQGLKNNRKKTKLENHLIEVEVIEKDNRLFMEIRYVKTRDGQQPWIIDSFSEVGDKLKVPIKKLNNYVIPNDIKILYGLNPRTKISGN